MGVTAKEMREYAHDILRRKTFKFHRINGLIDNRRHTVLDLAKAFAVSSQDARGFLHALRWVPEDLRERINQEFRLAKQNGGNRLELLRRIQEHIVSEGVYTDFGRPNSVGLILEKREFDGIELYFSLGESHSGLALRPGRVYLNPEGPTVALFYLWDALARVGETLDLLVSTRDLGEEGNSERTIYRTKREELAKWCRLVKDSEWISCKNPDFYLFTIAMRSVLSSLRHVAESAQSPGELLRMAINLQLDSLVAHEVSHLLERRANGSLPFNKEAAEIIAYLLQSVHSRPDYAYLSMLNRQFDFTKEMPDLVGDILSKGIFSNLEGSDYLRFWAEKALEREFYAYCGKRHSEVLETGKIKAAQTTDYIRPEHMPMVEKAMCNPSLQKSG